MGDLEKGNSTLEDKRQMILARRNVTNWTRPERLRSSFTNDKTHRGSAEIDKPDQSLVLHVLQATGRGSAYMTLDARP